MTYSYGVYAGETYGTGAGEDSHVGTGRIGLSGQSTIAQNYRAVGIGLIDIADTSFIAQNYRAVGVGLISISDSSVIAQNYRAVGVGQISIFDSSVTSKTYEAFGAGVFGLDGQSTIAQNYRAVGIGFIYIPDMSVVETGLSAIAVGWISTHYKCYLTGAADGKTDLEIKIKSFQTRFGSDPGRIYLSVVVPGVDAYIDEINRRTNGRLKINRIYNYSDGSQSVFEMAAVGIDTLATTEGGRSGVTGQLSGSENYTAGTAQTITLYSPVYRASEGGKRRFRCAIDPRVRPGDTVKINGETFVVTGIVHIIDTKTSIMEIQE